MKHNPRPFVVEVKRGTSRQSFQSHSLEADKFSAAEKLLFSAPQAERVLEAASSLKPGPSGRVLPVLSDSQQIVLADPLPAPRRGRPPGSKNKVKHPGVPAAPAGLVEPIMFEVALDVAEAEKPAIAERNTGDEWSNDKSLITPRLVEPPAEPDEPPARAIRLRDRSRILRRYVLGVEPRAGERRSFRNRKAGASFAKRDR